MDTIRASVPVYGMTCGNCVKKVKEKLNSIEGISNVVVSLENKKAEFNYPNDDNGYIERVKKEIEELGYSTIEPQHLSKPTFINELGTLDDLSLNKKNEEKAESSNLGFPEFNFKDQLGSLPVAETIQSEQMMEPQQGEINIAIPVKGMHCASCATSIEKSLKQDGVESAQVNYANEKAYINVKPEKSNLEEFKAIIENSGDYKVPTEKMELNLEGMHCASCAMTIEKGLNQISGLLSAKVNFASEKAYMEFIPGLTDSSEIKKVIKELGYSAGEIHSSDQDAFQGKEKKTIKLKLMLGIALSLPVMILSMGSDMLGWTIPYLSWILLFLTIPVQFYVGSQFLKGAYINAKHLRSNMDSLVSLGTLAAFFYSTIVTFNLIEGHLYFEASAVVITLVLLGKYFEAVAKGKTSEAIKKLMGLQVKTAHVIRNGEEIVLPIDEVIIGDQIIIKPGEKIPVDGKVLSGATHVDQSMITGEPLPKSVKKEDALIAGTINQEGSITMYAEKIGKETMLSRMIQMVEEAQGAKPQIQRFVDKVASVFVPIVLGIAFITLIAWMIYLSQTNLTLLEIIPESLINMVAVLVIACPCALGLATPTAIMVATGKGAENGILIKNGESLELLHQMDTVIFDKTGTVTEGKPRLEKIIPEEGFTEKDLLQWTASLENHSEHPLSLAFTKKAKEDQITLFKVTEFSSITGKGVRGKINGENFIIGNLRLLKEFNINISEEQNENTIFIYIVKNKELAGKAIISDVIRSEAKESITELNNLHIDTIMLTGDKESTAKAISDQLGINKYHAELLPQDKINFVKELQSQGKKVVMVGDGINDAPALAQADIGIAMQSGTDIAMEAADITIMKNNLLSVIEAINLSKKSMSTIKGNLFWAFIYNVVGIPLAALGFLNPMIAGTAMALSSVSVVSNSLMLKKKKLR